MRLAKARVQGYRSIIDSGWFDIENDKTILVGPNEAGKTAVLQALQKLNPPKGSELFNPLRDYPRAKYDEDIEKKGIDPAKYTVVEGHFSLEEADKDKVPESYRNVTYVCGRHLDNSTWQRLDNIPPQLTFSDIEKDLLKMVAHFQETATAENSTPDSISAIQKEHDAAISGFTKDTIITVEQATHLNSWLKKNIKFLDDDNVKENNRYEKIVSQLERPKEYVDVLGICKGGHSMSVDSERIITRKAMIYDLRIILKETPGLDPATVDAVIKIMDDYIVADIENEK